MGRGSDARLLAGFVCVGAVGFMTDAGLLATGTTLGLSPLVARGNSVVVALQLTFLLNGLLVFRSLTPTAAAGQWFAYMVANGLGAACNYAIFAALTVSRIPHLSDRAPAFVAAAAIALVVNFAGARFWAFRQAGAASPMSPPDLIDERYYQVVRPHSFAERLTIAARDRIYDDFLRLMKPQAGETILDVGASDVLNDAANLLGTPLSASRGDHGDRTRRGAGVPGGLFRPSHTGRWRRTRPSRSWTRASTSPCPTQCLNTSAATPTRRFFVSELQRVARRVFITVPHKYFPVEHHTGIPVLHFWRPSFAMACPMMGKSEWLDPSNLVLMSATHLSSLAPPGLRIRIGDTGLRLGPFSSNLFLAIQPGD